MVGRATDQPQARLQLLGGEQGRWPSDHASRRVRSHCVGSHELLHEHQQLESGETGLQLHEELRGRGAGESLAKRENLACRRLPPWGASPGRLLSCAGNPAEPARATAPGACPARPIPTGRPPSRRRGRNRGRLRWRRWAPAGCSRACEGLRARWYVREESSWLEARANGRVEPGPALPISCESFSGVGPSRSLEPRAICFSTLKQSQKAHEGREGRVATPSLEPRNAAVGTELSPKSLQLRALALICCQPPRYPARHHPTPPDL